MRLIALLFVACTSVAFAAEGVIESADKFWRLALPTGWSDMHLPQAMQNRLMLQAMAQNTTATCFVGITVLPDGRDDKSTNTALAAIIMDKLVVELQRQSMILVKGPSRPIEVDGQQAFEVSAKLTVEGEEPKAALFRIFAANELIYCLRAVQDNTASVTDPELQRAFSAFVLTKRPAPASADPASPGAAASATSAASAGTAKASESKPSATEPAKSGKTSPLVIIGIVAGIAVIIVLLLPLLLGKKKPKRASTRQRADEETIDEPQPRTASQRKTRVMAPPAPTISPQRRTTVHMPPLPPADGQPPRPTATVRRQTRQ